MEPKQDSYPFFEANQVLMNTHLNQQFNYLDEQERLTRANLIGIGIVCGLDISLDNSATPATIFLSKGCGITSEGYLIMEPNDLELVSYREYVLPDEVSPSYSAFNYDDNGTSTQYQLWELLAAGEPGNPDLLASSPGFLDDKAVVLFLELKKADLRNCSANNCDDKGAEVTATVRKLLISINDLDKIILAAKALESGSVLADPKATLAARLGLKDLKLPRYDVPNTNLVTSKNVLEGFLKALQENGFAKMAAEAITEAYNVFKPILPETTAFEPAFSNKFGFLDNPLAAIAAADVRFLQYYYDFFDDLIRAYDEFRWQGLEVLCACCPHEDLFPRHLMLGSFIPDAASHRHLFSASPAVNPCEALNKELLLLFQRMTAMIASFSNTPISETEIRMTPSKLADGPLSGKAIPYYYLQNTTPPLFQVWSPEKNRRNRANQNHGYRSGQYTPPAPDFISNALNYDLEPYNFLRIEGHLGKNYLPVLQQLQALKTQYRLPIELVSLRTGNSANNLPNQNQSETLGNFLIKHPGIQHKGGVPLGGTFILISHDSPGDSINTQQGSIIADFFLPYRVIAADCPCQMLTSVCAYEWIDSIKHLNYLTLRQYRFTATSKAPAANEKERNRLQNSYIIRIYRYEIQGKSLLSGNTAEDVVIPLNSLKAEKLSAVARFLNQAYPLGLVFDHKPGTNKLILRGLEGHHVRIELGGIQGNQIRYRYENGKIYRWQQETWQALDNTDGYDITCQISGGDYHEDDYQWLHENYKPMYPAPPVSPTAKEAIQWEKLTLMRARSYRFIYDLPIFEQVLLPVFNAIQGIDSNADVVLIGSWANGSWVSRNPGDNTIAMGNTTWPEFLQLRKKVTGKSDYSDIDLLIDSELEITPEMINVSTGYAITIIRGKKDAQKGLVFGRNVS